MEIIRPVLSKRGANIVHFDILIRRRGPGEKPTSRQKRILPSTPQEEAFTVDDVMARIVTALTGGGD